VGNILICFLLEYLVTQYLDVNETQLPSPEALKHKIILKVSSQNNNVKKSLNFFVFIVMYYSLVKILSYF